LSGETPAETLWAEVLGALQLTMERETFQRCLAGTWPLAWDPTANAWTIATSRAYTVDWLRHRLAGAVVRALARATPGYPPPQVEFVQAAPPAPERPNRAGGQRACPVEEPAPEAAAPAAKEARRPSARRFEAAAEWPSAPLPAPDGAELGPNDFYIKLKTAFRRRALRRLRGGARLAVWLCLGLHMDAHGVSSPGIKALVEETGYGRNVVCNALAELASPPLNLIEKLPSPKYRPQAYRMRGYIWFGSQPAPASFEQGEDG
jgi:hypothetical protein